MGDLFGVEPAAVPVPPAVQAVFLRANQARMSLSYTWDKSLPAAAFLMNNPSVAGGVAQFDPTARRTIHFAKALGAGSAWLFNWCPLVATKPADLWNLLKAGRFDQQLVNANLDAIARGAAAAQWHIVAMGPEGFRRHPELVRRALHAFMGKGAWEKVWQTRPTVREALCLGITPEGAPLHPLARGKFAIPNDRQPVPWTPAAWPPRIRETDPFVYGRV